MIPVVAMGLTTGVMLLSHLDTEAEADIKVPLGALTRKQWLDFVRVCSNGNPRTVTPSFRLGVFEMSVRRLCDLGVMHNPRVTHHNGNQVWDADWLNPASLHDFQENPMLQYGLFAESIGQYAAEPLVSAQIGKVVDGVTITFSGALMVAHRAGLFGLCSWVVNPHDREKFHRNTTTPFAKANGLF